VLPSFSVKTIFELFLFFSLRVSPCYAPLSPVLSGSCLRPTISTKPCVVSPQPPHRLWCTPLLPVFPKARHRFLWGGSGSGWKGPRNCRSRDAGLSPCPYRRRSRYLCPDRSPNRGRGRPSVQPNHLCPLGIARLIGQRIHPFKEAHCMRQSRMGLERGFVQPARMNEIQPSVSHRSEGVKTHAARLLPPMALSPRVTPLPQHSLSLTSMQAARRRIAPRLPPIPSPYFITSRLSRYTTAHFGGESKRGHDPDKAGQVYRAPTGQKNRRAGLPGGWG